MNMRTTIALPNAQLLDFCEQVIQNRHYTTISSQYGLSSSYWVVTKRDLQNKNTKHGGEYRVREQTFHAMILVADALQLLGHSIFSCNMYVVDYVQAYLLSKEKQSKHQNQHTDQDHTELSVLERIATALEIIAESYKPIVRVSGKYEPIFDDDSFDKAGLGF